MHALQRSHIDTVLQVAQHRALNDSALAHDDVIRQPADSAQAQSLECVAHRYRFGSVAHDYLPANEALGHRAAK